MSEIKVDWDKLATPIEFFGLSEPLEIDALKKVYRSFIKIYKPDNYPDEFKKIRKAYEELMDGVERKSYLDEINQKNSFAEEQKSEPKNENNSDLVVPVNNHLVKDNNIDNQKIYFSDEHLASIKDPKEYELLLSTMPLSAQTFLYKAFLSDVTTSAHDHFFYLMKGLTKISINDMYYIEFINHFIKAEVPKPEWLDILNEIASETNAQVFYYYLYTVFNQMSIHLDIKAVVSCLFQCEKKLIYRGDYLFQKQSLYLLLSEKAILCLDPDFYLPLLSFLQEYKTRLEDNQHFHLEFLLNLRVYYENRTESFAGHWMIKKADKIIKAYANGDELLTKNLLVDLKKDIKLNFEHDEILFSSSNEKTFEHLHKVISYIGGDIGHILGKRDIAWAEHRNSAIKFNNFVRNQLNKNMKFLLFSLLNIGKYRIILFSAFLAISFLIFLEYYKSEGMHAVQVLSLIHIGLFILGFFYNRYIDKKIVKRYLEIQKECCKNILQQKLMPFVIKKEILIDSISYLPRFFEREKDIEGSKLIFQEMTSRSYFLFFDYFNQLKYK